MVNKSFHVISFGLGVQEEQEIEKRGQSDVQAIDLRL